MCGVTIGPLNTSRCFQDRSEVSTAPRQREGDVGSYLYIDNFARAVRQTGNIINDLIPHVYDTERTIRIMGEDGKIDVMAINKARASTRRPARPCSPTTSRRAPTTWWRRWGRATPRGARRRRTA